MSQKNNNFKVGASVIVKPDTQDPDLEIDIGGWVGRILEIEEETINIQWDSITLSAMPGSIIIECEQKGLDWTTISLYPTELEQTKTRDTISDVKNAVEHIQSQHQWDYLGEEGTRIQKVLYEIGQEEERRAFEAWKHHFEKELIFPFDAEVSEYQESGYLQDGDKVKVLELTEIIEPYGIMVKIAHKCVVSEFPLCELEVIKKPSSNYQPVNDYNIWFSNR
ncbi:MAG: calcium-binding protein [Desulfosalsimonadaceae bacterium]